MQVFELAGALRSHVLRRPVPLLVLQLPQFGRVAWRDGRRSAQRVERSAARAFMLAARQCLRAQDLLAHDPDSDVFLAAIVATPRSAGGAHDGGLPNAIDCRSALERIAAGMSAATGLSVEYGWTLVHDPGGSDDLGGAVALALERGRRERERYEFFATVGHELRTPLTSIRGYVETLIDGGVDEITTRRFLETVRREALRVGRLVENMFEFSLLDLCASSAASQTCNMVRAVEAACDVVGPLAAARAIGLRNDVPPGTFAALDEDACLHATINLLDNAIKYGKEGGIVCVGARIDPPFVRVTVDDDGPGIELAEREKIFALRVRGAQPERPGTGIGLAIVRMIAERAGGEIAVMQSPLGGARFEMLLPLRAESAVPVS